MIGQNYFLVQTSNQSFHCSILSFMKTFLLILLLFVVAAQPKILKCLPGTSLQYNFVSDVGAFGSKKSEKLIMESQIEIQCVKSKGIRYYFIVIPSAILKQRFAGKSYKQHVIKGNINHFSVFALDKSGMVTSFINHVPPKKGDKNALMFYNIRKTIASLFQMKINGKGGSRNEYTPQGVVKAHYSYTFGKKGDTKIIKKFKSSDEKRVKGLKRHREVKFRMYTSAVFRDGIFRKIDQK